MQRVVHYLARNSALCTPAALSVLGICDLRQVTCPRCLRLLAIRRLALDKHYIKLGAASARIDWFGGA